MGRLRGLGVTLSLGLGLGLAGPAEAQVYLESEGARAFVQIQNIAGIGSLTDEIFSGPDEGNAVLQLPFAYEFLGTVYTEAWVGVNGYVVFGAGPFGSYINYAAGSASGANNAIFAWWDDLILGNATTSLRTGVIGAAPNRIFVIQAIDLEHWNYEARPDISWQVWLYEGNTGRFEVQVEGGLQTAELYTATSGWEGVGGLPSGSFRPCDPSCVTADLLTMSGRVFGVQRPEGPELVGQIDGFARGALPGAQASGQVILQNAGTVAIPNAEANIYLSLDETVDGTDVLVGSVPAVPLAAASEFITTATITVPLGTAAGDYRLVLEVDPDDLVTESVENNNVAVADANFATAYELSPIDIDVDDGAPPGGTIFVDAEFANVGIPRIGDVTVELRLSSDRTLDAGDVSAGLATVTLDGGLTNQAQLQFTVPPIQPGSFYPIIVVDPANGLFEYDETNNALAEDDRIPTGPDLLVTDIAPPPGVAPGQAFSVDLTMQSLGTGYAGNVDVRVVLSLDPILNGNDPFAGSATVLLSGLPSEVVTVPLTMPQVGAGAYYVIVRVDPADLIGESDEFNNIYVGTDLIGSAPDIVVTDLDGPTATNPGETIAVDIELSSLGAPLNGTVSYRLYLSEDRVFDGADTAIGDYTVTFAGEALILDTQNPTVPLGLPPVRHYLISIIDPTGALIEAREDNQVFIDNSSIGTGTDLRTWDVDVPFGSVYNLGDSIEATIEFNLFGAPPAVGIRYAVWLSRDEQLDPALDIQVASDTMFFNGQFSVDIPVSIPVDANVPTGTLRLIADIDSDGMFVESREDNNDDASREFRITGPNLSFTDLQAPSVLFTGQTHAFTVSLANAGVRDIPAATYSYYLTRTGLIRPGDATEIFQSAPFAIAAGGARSFTESVTIPTTAGSTGTILLAAVLDPTDAVAEEDETDNIGFRPGGVRVDQPAADLLIELDDVPGRVAPGEQFVVARSLRNTGVVAAPVVNYSYFLSQNAVIAPDDVEIGQGTVSIGIGGFETGIDTVRLPTDILPGTYYLGAFVDPLDAVQEVDETNNAFVGPQVVVDPPELSITTGALPSGRLDRPYETFLQAAGPLANRTWNLESGALAPGLQLDPVTGRIFGTPTQQGRFDFRVSVEADGRYAERDLALLVRVAGVGVSIDTTQLGLGFVGRPYEARIIAAGGAPPYTFGVRSGLPLGLSATSTGGVSGTPLERGNFIVSVVVTDQLGDAAIAEIGLNIVDPGDRVVIAQTPLPRGVLSEEYCLLDEVQLFAEGGIAPYVWTLVGEAGGLSLSPEGALCGVPASVGRFEFVITVRDGLGLSDTALFVLQVDSDGTLRAAFGTLADARVNQPYQAQLEALGGTAPYMFTLLDGVLPSGLSLGEDGIISGTPTTEELQAFTLTLTDQDGAERLLPLSIRVLPEDEGGGCGCAAAGAPERTPGRGVLAGLLVLMAVWRRRRWVR